MRHPTGLRNLFSIPLAAALVFAPYAARAQDDPPPPATKSFALDRFTPSFAGDRFLGVQSPLVSGHLVPHAMLIADYAYRPLVLRRDTDPDALGSVVENQLMLHLNGGITLWNRVGINVDIPFALYQNGDNPAVEGEEYPSPDSAQIGDIRIGLRLRIVGGYYSKFHIGFGGYIWIPSGSNEPGSFVSDGSARGLIHIMIGGRAANRVVWALAFGPEIRPEQTYGNVFTGPSFNAGAGVGVLFGEKRHLQLGVESTVVAPAKDEFTSRRNTNLELLAMGRYRFLGPMEAALGVGPGLAPGIGTPSLRVAASIAYSPEPEKPATPKPASDWDRDGVIDNADACPDKPGVASPDPKKNGCPLIDTDKDGIFDEADACPLEPGLWNHDPRKNGCPPPPDRDMDGIIDAGDACVDVVGVADLDPKKNGCPPDKDSDNVIDVEDACVDIAGLKTADPATNGCPGDTDGDTIRDDKDACPREKGKPNADPQKNGCPVSVRVTEQEIIILQQVQFDTARATIKKVSDPLLDEVAEVMKEHPEIIKIEVQGHTDNVGPDKVNERLSDNRAKAVVAALIKRGIAKERLVGKGYGEAQPIDTNDTPEGRQKNRRVQFKIAERAKP